MTDKFIEVQVAGTPLPAKVKTFSTGSTGYFVSGKVLIEGEPHQVTCSIVKVGSNPNKQRNIEE